MNSGLIVNNYNFDFIKKIKNVSNVQQMRNIGLSKDVFQKSNISFKGSGVNEDEELNAHMSREAIFIGLLEGHIQSTSTRRMISNSLNYADQAHLFKDTINQLKDIKPDAQWDFVIDLLNKSNITTFTQLDNFIQSYRKDKNAAKVFEYQEVEALEIYRELEDKSDMRNFPELLLGIHYINKEKGEDEKIDSESILKFLKQIGVKNQEEFNTKFSYLKPEFNNFEKTEDKMLAIYSLTKNHYKKMDFLEEKTNLSPKLSSEKPEKIYAQINDIVDYFYKINEGESLDGIDDILELALTQGKIKKTSLDKIAPYFNNFEDTTDKIQFYKLLNSSAVDIQEFNNLASNSVISDTNVLENIEKKKYYTARIAQLDGENENSAIKLYSNFKDLINAVCQDTTKANANLRLLMNVIKQNKITNSASMLNFYQKMTGKRPKALTKAEFEEFIELFNFQTGNLQEVAKKKKVSPIELLKEEKARFEKVKEDIEIAKKSGSIVFASQSAVDIYNNYKEVILKSDDVVQTVKQIAMFGIGSSEEYQGKMQEVEKFRKFFSSDEDLSKFIETNSIRFDGSKAEAEFIENCMEIFNFILNSNDKNYQEKMEYFANSGFLIKSQDNLEKLLEKTDTPHKRREVFSTIVNKEIPSVGDLEKFINKFKLPNSNGEKLFNYIKNLPNNCDFKKVSDTLNRLSALITEKSLPLQINESNINLINPNSYEDCLNDGYKMTSRLFKAFYKPKKKCNFLRTMSSTEKTNKEKFSAFNIAWELANNIEKSDESYQNITRLLRIDKESLGLREKCSPRDYTYAIKKSIDQKFVNFINSDEFFENVTFDNTVPNVQLHARLRLLDRFILPEVNIMSDIEKSDIQEKIKNTYETIFASEPYEVEGFPGSKRIEAYYDDGNQKFKVIFSPTGEMITITPPKDSMRS